MLARENSAPTVSLDGDTKPVRKLSKSEILDDLRNDTPFDPIKEEAWEKSPEANGRKNSGSGQKDRDYVQQETKSDEYKLKDETRDSTNAP